MNDMPLIAVDSNWLTIRNFCASGMPQNQSEIVSSYLCSISKLMKEYKYEVEIAALWDAGKWRYRDKEKFPDYKAGRNYDDTWDVVFESMKTLHDLLPKLGIRSYRVPGAEADDISFWTANQNRITLNHSKDRDWFIGINDTTAVIHPDDGLVDCDLLRANYGVENGAEFLIYKAIIGDSSDNIVGITEDAEAALTMYHQFKSGELAPHLKMKIIGNMELMRIDRILDDQEAIEILEEQSRVVTYQQRALFTLEAIIPGRYPAYLHGTFGKYNRNITSKLVEEIHGLQVTQ